MNNNKQHLLKTLSKNIRYDGRSFEQFRDISIEYGATKNAEGSARVKIGDTEVIAGVKISVDKPFPDTADEGILMIGTELLPMSSPEFESGPPDIKSIEISRVVDRGIRESKAIDLKKLCITKGEKVWMISVDICSVNDSGNLMDTAALAAIAALKDAKFPEYNGGIIDYKKLTDKRLPLHKTPVEVTVIKIGEHFLIDPTTEEEEMTDSRITVALSGDGNLSALQKGGDSTLSLEDVDLMIKLAEKKAKELEKKL